MSWMKSSTTFLSLSFCCGPSSFHYGLLYLIMMSLEFFIWLAAKRPIRIRMNVKQPHPFIFFLVIQADEHQPGRPNLPMIITMRDMTNLIMLTVLKVSKTMNSSLDMKKSWSCESVSTCYGSFKPLLRAHLASLPALNHFQNDKPRLTAPNKRRPYDVHLTF